MYKLIGFCLLLSFASLNLFANSILYVHQTESCVLFFMQMMAF